MPALLYIVYAACTSDVHVYTLRIQVMPLVYAAYTGNATRVRRVYARTSQSTNEVWLL